MEQSVMTATNGDLRAQLPKLITMSTPESNRIPSPGTQRAIKAETGKNWDELVGPDSDGADRIQTLIWMKLRMEFPGLRWADCDDVEIQVEEGPGDVDPSPAAVSASSQPSAASGG